MEKNISKTIERVKAAAAELLTQDNLCTADPIFCVQLARAIVAPPGHYDDKCWMSNDGEYDVYYEEPDDPGDADEFSFCVIWFTCASFFTYEGALEYIKSNGHNLHCDAGKEPRIYVESMWRWREMIDVRDMLLGLAEGRLDIVEV